MLRVGLTGGIACGKSAVAGMFRELGLLVIEADAVAHRLTDPGQPAYEEILHDFGRQILSTDGRIDRSKLARIVFSDPARMYILNEIVHPKVTAEFEREFAELQRLGRCQAAVVEAALLVETGYYQKLHRLVVVWCLPEQQVKRLVARGLSREQAEQRIASQAPLEQKRAVAHDLIDCSHTLEDTRQQVAELAGRLKQLAAQESLP